MVHDEYLLADLTRAITLALGGGIIALTILVGIEYRRAYRAHRRRRAETPWQGAAIRHVIAIAASYLILAVGALTEMYLRIHEPLTWRPFAYGGGYLVGIYALFTILRFERARLVASRIGPPDPPV